MEKCPNCGNKLSNIDVLCPRCGALVEIIQVKNSLVPPSATSEESTLPGSEQPDLIIYNEDFPGDEPVSDESGSNEESVLDTTGKETDTSGVLSAEDTSSPQISAAQPVHPFLPERLYESPEELEREMEAESRMARRARQKKWPEPQDTQPSPDVSDTTENRSSRRAARHTSASEEQLLKEAEELTSGVSWRSRVTGTSAADETLLITEEPIEPTSIDDADFPARSEERPVPRYRAEYRASLRSGRQRKDTQSKSRIPVPVAILLWVVIAAALFLGFYYFNQYVITAYGNYSAFIKAITYDRVSLGASGDISAINVDIEETQTESGAPSHTFTVVASGASSVRFFPTGDVFEIKDGTVTFEVSDESIALARGVLTYDSSIMVEGISLEFTMGASTVSYPIDPLEIRLISSEYKREKPDEPRSVSTEDTVLISLKIAPGATVFINNNNYTDNITDDGHLSVELPLTDEGDTKFVVDVMQPGRQAVRDNFTVTRQKEQTVLQPEAEYLRTYTDSFECRGVTDAGATLSAQLNDKTFAGLVSDSGAYSVACKATEYGLYNVTLTAAVEGKLDTSVTISVERLPEAKVFQANARKMTADSAIKNAASLLNTGIRLETEISDVTTDGLAQKFSVPAGSAKLECYYYGQTPALTAGQKYTLYGMMDEAGGFYVMFIE